MNLIAREKAAHFYTYDREDDCFRALYEVMRKDGKGMKPTTLREARELGLCWSVSRVCACVAKPGLEVWKIESAIMAALTLPKSPNEPLDAFARRVVEDMDSHSSKAREFGSLLHRQIEDNLAGRLEPDPTCEKHLKLVRNWMDENCEDIHASEIIVGDPCLGVAGKLDLDCTVKGFGRCIIDTKTQRVRNGKPTYYPEWAVQLAFYRHARQREFGSMSASAWLPLPMRIVSLVIDSDPDEPAIYAHWWSDEIDYLKLFVGLLDWLCFTEDYDPRIQLSLEKETA